MLRIGLEPIPGYRLLGFIGSGNFGDVWKASGPGGVTVALKFISLEQGRGGLKEFRAVQQIRQVRHVHLVQVFGIWATDQEHKLLTEERLQEWAEEISGIGTTRALCEDNPTRPTGFIVAMQLGDKNLFDRLTECKAAGLEGIPIEELLNYMTDGAKALDFLNTPQHPDPIGSSSSPEPELVWISHSDIKPQNIVLCRDAAQVCDFGLARVMRSSLALTTYAGAPAYSAPECFKSGPSRTSDQYSLAITYLQLRTGSLPFREGATVHEVVAAHTQGHLDLSRLSRRERSVIAKATALDHTKRFASAQSMVTQLREAIKNPPPPAWKKFAATAVLAACITALIYYIVDPPPPTPPDTRPNVAFQDVPPGKLRAGQSLTLTLVGTGAFEYRVDPEKDWKPAPDGKVVIQSLPKGPLAVEARARDGQKFSAVARREWEVEPPPPPPPRPTVAFKDAPPPGKLQAGQSLTLTLVGTGTFEYRVNPDPETAWKPAADGKVVIPSLPNGPLVVEAHARDGQKFSAVVRREWVVEPPINRPPTLEIVDCQPSEPVSGQPFTVSLGVKDPDHDTVTVEYSVDGGDWRPVDGNRVVIKNPTSGDLRLSLKASDKRGAKSAPLNRTWHLRPPAELTNSIGLKLVRIEAGTFMMGSPIGEEGHRSDERQHDVQIARAFYMAATEVTQKQYEAVMHVNPAFFGANDDFPVERVSWKDAVEFCRLLTASAEEQAAGRKYRLPTEEEWEYACRAGSNTAYFTGGKLDLNAANFVGSGLHHPKTVGSLATNQFGLFDMAGNVYDGCADWYSEDYTAAKAAGSRMRVTRGGGFRSNEKACRSASRRPQSPDDSFDDTGFRVVCELQAEAHVPSPLSFKGLGLDREP